MTHTSMDDKSQRPRDGEGREEKWQDVKEEREVYVWSARIFVFITEYCTGVRGVTFNLTHIEVSKH